MAKYVVAGVTGRVGRVVAERLLANGERPTVIVRDPARAGDWPGRGATIAIGSLGDQPFLTRALEGADGLFTLVPENVDPTDFHGARRRMVDAIAGAVEASGVPRVVLLSAVAAVLPSGNGPAADLHYAEERLRASGTTKLSALRAAYLQDNVRDVIAPARMAGIYPNFMASADAAFPMIAARDAGGFAADTLGHRPAAHEVVDLLGPAYSVRDVATRLGQALGRTLQIVDIPPEGHVTALTGAGLPQQLAEAVAEMFAAFSAGLIVPQGDRREMGTTTIDEVIAVCLRVPAV
jgi:uncharacterized protein YbjT (DUF2867 family)